MKERVVAKRYGRAIFELALEQGAVDAMSRDLLGLQTALRDLPLIRKALTDERIERNLRATVAERILSILGITGLLARSVDLLVRKGRFAIVDLIGEDVARRVKEYRKITDVRVVMADAALSENLKTQIETILAGILHDNVQCDMTNDPALLGGFILWLGDVCYDASLRGRIDCFRHELLATYPDGR